MKPYSQSASTEDAICVAHEVCNFEVEHSDFLVDIIPDIYNIFEQLCVEPRIFGILGDTSLIGTDSFV